MYLFWIITGIVIVIIAAIVIIVLGYKIFRKTKQLKYEERINKHL